jgi:hypothetical protein
LADGVAAVGALATYARADHVHPIVAMNDNRIINGDMRIDQRWSGAGGTTQGYTIDRWGYVNSTAPTGRGTWARVPSSSVPSLVALGFGYCFSFISSSAYVSAASDAFQIYQAIEADMISDFAWGTANAQPVTLSFWFNSSLTGTFSGAIKNDAATRTYLFIFAYPAATVWQKVVITIPGDTGGTWVMSGNARGMYLNFDLGSGATYRGPANAWASTNYNGVTGAVSIVATNGAAFYVTGVKLEIGSVATPYNRQSLTKSLADCQRYYSTISVAARFAASAAGQFSDQTMSFQSMRAAPAAALVTAGSTANITGSSTVVGLTTNSARFEIASAAAGDAYNLGAVYSLSAEL